MVINKRLAIQSIVVPSAVLVLAAWLFSPTSPAATPPATPAATIAAPKNMIQPEPVPPAIDIEKHNSDAVAAVAKYNKEINEKYEADQKAIHDKVTKEAEDRRAKQAKQDKDVADAAEAAAAARKPSPEVEQKLKEFMHKHEPVPAKPKI